MPKASVARMEVLANFRVHLVVVTEIVVVCVWVGAGRWVVTCFTCVTATPHADRVGRLTLSRPG